MTSRGDGCKLLVLLESPTPDPPSVYGKPEVDGSIQDGKLVDYTGRPTRTRKILISAIAVTAITVAVASFALANRARDPAPVCASGELDIEGSTAFAPVFNEVVTEYVQLCPGAHITVRGVGSEKTTMDLRTYINQTHGAIGYAEADALPFFSDVGAIPINGYEPTRANALNGTYTFLATEHLYTSGVPAGLAADLINFLTSSAVTAQLRDISFIACSNLAGSKLSGDCVRRSTPSRSRIYGATGMPVNVTH